HVLLYNLPFPERTSCVEKYENIYAYKEDQKQVQDYVFRKSPLLCNKDIWDSIVHFQEENREIARRRQKEKLSAQINKIMELVPALPGDWRKWIEKVGADKNYIFYDAGKGVQTGYCTYCEREVPVKIGRASCRERVSLSGGAGVLREKTEPRGESTNRHTSR